MPFCYTHCLIALNVLRKLEKRKVFSSYENIDDYLFGSIAPDVRYVSGHKRDHTHEPFGKTSAFEAFNKDKYSKSFIAGYETHLIADRIWSKKEKLLDKSAWEFFNVDPNKIEQKFALYFLVDDYFQAQSNWTLPLSFSGNAIRADKFEALYSLGIKSPTILLYKAGIFSFLREPGLNSLQYLHLLRLPIEEKIIANIIKKLTPAGDYLKKFFDVSVDTCIEAIEKRL